METKPKTKIYNLIILDKSGSMSSIAKAVVAGFNETVSGVREAQKRYAETQEHCVSLLAFCSCSREYLYNCAPVDKVKELKNRDYQPCCGTPLYDAMGQGINDLYKITKSDPDASVMVTVITDGLENSSTEYSGRDIKALVDKMRSEHGWNFSYIGTNQDVEAVAQQLSINNTMFFEDSEVGMAEAWQRERKARARKYDRIDEIYACPSVSVDDKVRMKRDMLFNEWNYRELAEFAHRFTPNRIDTLAPGQIFVFGSNGAGHHAGGAAHHAMQRFGAIYGQANGLQGQSYAIDTMDGLGVMERNVNEFVAFAKEHPELTFLVTRIGCGIAGYEPTEVEPLFMRAIDVENIWLPKDFWEVII